MRLRVVDYVANLGGGIRFSVEAMRPLLERGDVRLDVVSHGSGLERYRSLLASRDRCRVIDLPPANLHRLNVIMQGKPGAGPLNWLLGRPEFHFDVPKEALEDTDVVWFPWLHRHRVPSQPVPRIIGSLHDVIILEFPGIVPERFRKDEHETIRRWLRSAATVAVSSRATRDTLRKIFGGDADRVMVVPISGEHAEPRKEIGRQHWPFEAAPFLISPANVTAHKNHEVLFAGVGAWRAQHPLVLTGEGTALFANDNPRSRALRRAASRAGLEWERTLFGLGYVGDPTYYALLDEAWGLVMPTLAEGGGSFPVMEAMYRGLPVIASDIPVLREMAERMEGEPIWFDPRSAADLARKLGDLEQHYDEYQAAAREQAGRLRRRTWNDVSRDYGDLIGLPRNEGSNVEERTRDSRNDGGSLNDG